MFFHQKAARLFSIVCIVFLALLGTRSSVQAAALSSASVRLDRTKASTNPGNILIQLKTGETVTENGVQITVGSDWSISTSASSFTVSTAGLPAGTTALPGIGTATNVAGQVITFPANDITAGTTYGFYITGGIPTNPTVGSNYTWSVATLVGGSPSSVSNVGMYVNANDQVVLTATVGTTAADFSAVLSTPNTATLSPGSVVDYTITYGTTYVDSTPITLQAEWSLGTLAGGSTPTVPVFEYVSGSASDAYGATPPVIDTNARTITWTIANVPGNTINQTVTFQLRALSVDTGTTQVTVPVATRIINPSTTADSVNTQTYQFTTFTPTATPAPTSVPGQSPTSTPAPGDKKACNLGCSTDTECATNFCDLSVQKCRDASNPTDLTCSGNTPITPDEPDFEYIAPTQISNNSATISVSTSQPSTVTIRYGLSPNQLTNTLTSSESTRLHQLLLQQLLANTDYYFQIDAFSVNGKLFSSDIYHFKTARTVLEVDLSQLQAFFTTNGILIYSQLQSSTHYPIVLPYKTEYELTILLPHISKLKTVKMLSVDMANSTILDLNKAQLITDLTETQQNTFSGKAVSPGQSSQSSLGLYVEDFEGNLLIVPLNTLLTSAPLSVVSSKTGEPLDHIRATMYRFDEQTQIYSVIPVPALILVNPLFSDNVGRFQLTLPPGKYQAEVSGLGYHRKTVQFEVGGKNSGLYPLVQLDPAPFNIYEFVGYYVETLQQYLAQFILFFTHLRSSKAIFQLLSALTLGISIGLSFLGLTARMGISLKHLPSETRRKLALISHPNDPWQIKGILKNKDGKLLANAIITVFDKDKKVLMTLFSNQRGEFNMVLKDTSVILLAAIPGYLPQELNIEKEKTKAVDITLEQSETIQEKFGHEIIGRLRVLFDAFFEIFLIGSFALEILFMSHFGVAAVLPFVGLTVLNGLMWFIHLFHENIF